MKSEILQSLLNARRAKRAVALATDLESGEQWLIESDASAAEGAPEGLVEEAHRRLRSDTAGRVELGGRELFVNVFNPPHRMIVVGAVHIAQALVPMAAQAGFRVVLVDPRESFANTERFPGAEIVREWPDPALAALGLDARCAVVTLSHDPKLDDPALVAALDSEAFYIGSLGSRKTHAARLERLRERGVGDEALGRIHGPVGLDIGSRTPAEIAVSIVAQAIEALRKRA